MGWEHWVDMLRRRLDVDNADLLAMGYDCREQAQWMVDALAAKADVTIETHLTAVAQLLVTAPSFALLSRAISTVSGEVSSWGEDVIRGYLQANMDGFTAYLAEQCGSEDKGQALAGMLLESLVEPLRA